MTSLLSPTPFTDSRRPVAPRPLRVLELRCADGAGGGPEKTILYGAARTDRRRFAVTVCYIRNVVDEAFDVDRRAEKLGLDYTEIRQRHGFDPALLPAARRLVRARRIDLVHAHDYKTNLLALVLARLEGVIPLSTVHGWTGNSWRERWVYYPADKRLLARFPRLIAVSGEIRRELIRHGAHPERVTTVLNGIDPERFRRDDRREAARARFGLAPGEIALGAVGRLARQKRFDLLLQAFARLRQERPHVRLLIAGEGELREDLQAEADRLGLGASCRLLGHVRDVVELHHALDVLVQSSEYEGTPNVVLEAMALETPVVATDVGGTSELLRDEMDGLIVAPGDPEALAAAVRRTLVEPEDTARRVRAARRRIERELSFESRMHAVEAIYEELAADSRSSLESRL
jgi:glycosyltransferase involved in cell wall biosynthesis